MCGVFYRVMDMIGGKGFCKKGRCQGKAMKLSKKSFALNYLLKKLKGNDVSDDVSSSGVGEADKQVES